MRTLSHCLTVCALAVLLLTAQAVSGPPLTLGHQGRILNADGTPVSGNQTITFRLFDAPTAGSLLWEEIQSVPVDDGLYATQLGKLVPMDFESFGTRPDSLWLEIKIGEDAPLTPRTALSASPMAAVATSVRGDIVTSTGSLILDPDDDGDGFGVAVDTKASWANISKADAKRALNMAADDNSVGITISDSSIDHSLISLLTDGNESGLYISDGADAGRISLTVPSFNDPSAEKLPTLSIHEEPGTTGTSPLYESRSTPRGWTLFDSFGQPRVIATTDNDTPSMSVVNDTADMIVRPDGLYTSDPGVGPRKWMAPESIRLSRGVAGGGGGGGRIAVLALTDTSVVNNIWWQSNDASEPHATNRIDSSQSWESKAAAERAFDAVITVENGVKESPTDSVRGMVMSRVITGPDTSTAFTVESSPAGGSMQVFTTLGSYWFDLGGVSYTTMSLIRNNDDTTVYFDGNGHGRLSSQLSVGTPEQLATLTVAGDICATGTIGACSDARYKSNIAPIDNALKKVSAMQGVSYEWQSGQFEQLSFEDGRHLGVIAQEILEVAPEVVTESDNGLYAVDYGKLTPILIEAIKEQQQTIQNQTTELEQMRQRLSRLEALVIDMVGQPGERAVTATAPSR